MLRGFTILLTKNTKTCEANPSVLSKTAAFKSVLPKFIYPVSLPVSLSHTKSCWIIISINKRNNTWNIGWHNSPIWISRLFFKNRCSAKGCTAVELFCAFSIKHLTKYLARSSFSVFFRLQVWKFCKTFIFSINALLKQVAQGTNEIRQLNVIKVVVWTIFLKKK